ncbi:hypothetical protein GCM10010236_07690 [Streptomyces eurythermus]|nr:hypothetical protein GCM10010236_07690 [Streptomyces eurythermus]
MDRGAAATAGGSAAAVSQSAADRVKAVDFVAGRETASVEVGQHPRRVRLGLAGADRSTPAGG